MHSETPETAAALAVSDLAFGFGAEALWDGLSLRIEAGTIHGLFGNNGSGKTTLFNVICGFHRPWTGTLRYFGHSPAKHAPLEISRCGRGVTRTFQVPTLVEDLSVEENLLLASPVGRETLLSAFTFHADALPDVADRIEQTLADFQLAQVRSIPLGAMSYGLRRLTAVLIAILSGAGLVLLDEPFANLAPDNVERLKSRIREEARARGRGFLVIEHTPQHLAGFVDHLHLLNHQIVTVSEPDRMERAMHRFALGLEA